METLETSIFHDRIVYGTFWERFAASFIDILVLTIPLALTNLFIHGGNYLMEMVDGHITAASIYRQLVRIIVTWLYSAFMEASPAQATFGKQALSLKVTDVNGNPISFKRATGRYFGKYISELLIFTGYLLMLGDDYNQTLHDKMAGTLVIKKTPKIA